MFPIRTYIGTLLFLDYFKRQPVLQESYGHSNVCRYYTIKRFSSHVLFLFQIHPLKLMHIPHRVLDVFG